MKFSILVPVYNAEQYLRECIESVLAQTYTDYELILVNDGSTDRSGEICDTYANKYDNFFVYHKNNRGQLHTREYAVSKAKGDYYVFLDSDDTLRSNALEVIRDKIQAYDCDCVIYEFEKYTNGQSIDNRSDFTKPDQLITNKRELYRMALLNHRYNSMCRKAIKASVFTGRSYEGFYHIRHGEDLLQSLEILENCDTVVVISQPLYIYRMNEKSVTHTICYEKYRVDFAVEEQILLLLARSNVFNTEDYREFRDYRILLFIEKMRGIATLEASYLQKKEILRKMRDSSYFSQFLAAGITDKKRLEGKSFYFDLFCKKKYRTLILCEKIYVCLRHWIGKG